MLISSFLALVDRVFAGFAEDTQGPIYGMLNIGGKTGKQGRRRRFSATGPRVAVVDKTVSKAVEVIEPKIVLSGTAIGDPLETFQVGTQFSELGHFGDSRVFGDTLIIPGTRNDGAPVAWILNQTTGVSEEVVFPGSGNISGVFQGNNGEFVFTGFLDTATGRKIAYWDDDGEHVSSSLGEVFDITVDGRAVGSRGSINAQYYDVGVNSAVQLPGIGNMYVSAYSTTDDGLFFGGSAGDEDLNTFAIVYEKQANGSYALLDVQYVTPEGLSLLRMDVVDGPDGPIGVGVYPDVNGVIQTGLWNVADGAYRTHLGSGYATSAVYEGGYLILSTDQGIVTATNLTTLQTETYTAAALFGSAKDFKRGSLFITTDGNLGVVGTDPVTKLATVITFQVGDAVPLGQVPNVNVPLERSGNVTWGAVDGANGYQIDFKQNNIVVHSASATSGSYPVPTSLLAGPYKVRVRAIGDVGVAPGAWSADVTLNIKPPAVASATVTGKPVTASSSGFTLGWGAVEGGTSYGVTVAQAGSSARTLPIFEGTVTTNMVNVPTGLPAGVYTFRVTPFADGVEGDATTVTFTVKHGSVDADSLRNLPIVPGTPTLGWDPVFGASRYRVRVYEIGSSTPIFDREVTSNVVGLPIARTGRYKLSVQVPGYSESTNGVETVKLFTVLPPKPGSLVASQLIAGVGTRFTFGAVSGADSYDVRIWDVLTARLVLSANTTSTFYNVPGGFVNRTYRIEVRAKDSVGTSEWKSLTVTFVPLAQVGGVNVVGLASAQVPVTFSWRSVSGATRYLFKVLKGDTVVRQVFVTGTSFTLAGLVAGKYQVQVTASNLLVWGPASTAMTITVKVSVPTNLRTSTIQVGDLPRLVWSAVPGATGYDIWTGSHRLTSAGPSITGPANLPAGTHPFWVRAFNADGPGAWTSVNLVVTPLAKVGVVTVSGRTVSWGAIPGATGYDLSVYTYQKGTWVRAMNVAVGRTSYTLPVLPAARYQIFVKAKKGTFTGPWSAGKAHTVKLAPVIVVTPTIMVGEVNKKVTWTGVTGATSYEVLVRVAGTPAIVHRGTATGLSYVLPALPAGRYEVLVRGKNADPSLTQTTYSMKLLVVAPLPEIVKTYDNWVRAVTGSNSFTLVIRDARLKVLVTYSGSNLAQAALKLVSLPNGNYPNILRVVVPNVGVVEQVMRFTKPHPAPRISVTLPTDKRPLVTWSPVVDGKVVSRALITFYSPTGKVKEWKIVEGRLGRYKFEAPLPKGLQANTVCLYFADGTRTEWYTVKFAIL